MKPNIFKYAKTEASQDAFLTYVLSFYSDNLKEYKNEYKFSEFLLKKLIDKVGLKNLVVESLEIRQQFLLIDILLIINDSIYIIIENKTNTSERLDQIKNYREKITNHFSKRENIEENVHCIYYKIGDESYANISNIQKNKNTATLLRDEIIEIFQNYSGENLFINDYYENLKSMDDARKSFLTKNIDKDILTLPELNQFYHELDKVFLKFKSEGKMNEEIGFNWDYTNNKKGGFLCYYFTNIANFESYGFYMQLECTSIFGKTNFENLRFVIKVWSDEKTTDILYRGLEILKKYFGERIIKPTKFSPGSWMTQAIVKDYLAKDENGVIDVAKTATTILEYLSELKKLSKKLEALK